MLRGVCRETESIFLSSDEFSFFFFFENNFLCAMSPLFFNFLLLYDVAHQSNFSTPPQVDPPISSCRKVYFDVLVLITYKT